MNPARLQLVTLALSLTLVACGGSGESGGSGSGSGTDGSESTSANPADLPKAKTDADEMMVDYIESCRELVNAFESVTDSASAEAAGEVIGRVSQTMQERASEWESLPQDQVQASSARYSSHFDDVMQRLSQASMSLATNPEYAPLIQKAMESMAEFPEAK